MNEPVVDGRGWDEPTRLVCRVSGVDVPGMSARMSSPDRELPGDSEGLQLNGFRRPDEMSGAGMRLDSGGAGWGIRSLLTSCVYVWGRTQQDAELMRAASGTPDRYEVVRRCRHGWVSAGPVSLQPIPRFALSPQALPVRAAGADGEEDVAGQGLEVVPSVAPRPMQAWNSAAGARGSGQM